MSSVEERLREALQERADAITPNQPVWEDLASWTTRGSAAGRQRFWLTVATAVATAAAAVLLPFLVVARFVRPASHLKVDGGRGLADPANFGGSPVTGPPDGTLDPRFRPTSITRISLRIGWALGTLPCGAGACVSLARTRDSGATWHAVPVPTALLASGAGGVSRVRFANASDGWLFGPQVWATHDGGNSWHEVAALGGPVNSLEAADGKAWALMLSGDGATATVYSAPAATDDWKPAGPVAAGTTAITLNGKVGYAATPDGAVIALGPSGIEQRSAPCTTASLAAVAAAGDTDVGALCAGDPGAGSSTKTLLVSHNGGRTWSTSGAAPRGGQTSGLAAASVHTFVVGATSGASYLYRTTDGGKTWKTVFTSPGGAPLVDLGFTDPTHGVAVVAAPDPSLLVSSDAGATWKAQVFTP